MSIRTPSLSGLPARGLIIGSDRIDHTTGGDYEHRYPANGQRTSPVPLAGADEIDHAVGVARKAFKEWRTISVDQRRKLLLNVAKVVREHADELALLNTIDNGTPSPFARAAPSRAAELFEYNAGWADKLDGAVVPTWPTRALDYTLAEPYGVVGIIIPWNGPLGSAAATMAPALAAGNCVIMKPPEISPWSVLRLGELILEAGMPPGVVNIVPAGPAGGDALVRHPGVGFVHFTGGGPTAQVIMHAAADTLKPVGLELGGKSPRLIFPDCDVAAAVAESVGNIAVLSGQGCLFGMRVLAHADVYDQVVELAQQAAERVVVGDPLDPATRMGPVVNEQALQRILGVIQTASAEGAKLVTGGGRLGDELADGYFLEPTIFADVEPASQLSRNEVFGPVLSITKFADEDEAIELANDSDYGLASYVWTNDLQRAHRVAAEIDAGTVWINGWPGPPLSAAFGGNKQSGFGRLGGLEGVREFMHTKNVWIPLEPQHVYAM